MLETLFATDGGLTLLAPLVAITLALVSKRVVLSLSTAIVVGALVAADFDVVLGMYSLLEFIRSAVMDGDHLTVSAFSVLVAATVGVMGRSGGTRAMVALMEPLARSRRGAMVSTWVSGALVFFDDYANCLVVGSAMGPVCDRNRVSRAKLAYIVDSTAAPIASLAVVSTWVGYEVGVLGGALEAGGSALSPFSVFLSSLPYRFYCILTLVFVGAIAWTGRDFGPMAAAEAEAARAPAPPDSDARISKHRAWLAVAPVLALVVGTFTLLVIDGRATLGDEAVGASLPTILGEANPYSAMFWASLTAFGLSVVMTLAARVLPAGDTGKAALGGAKAVLKALLVLYLAWTLGDVIKATGAGDFLSAALGERLPPWSLPAVTFVLAGGTAFSVGSSFFTMGALLPLVIPLAVTFDGGAGGPILLATAAAVLDGAVLGDHASPISDTTILSSLGSQVDLVTHVKTQLPYALTAGAIALVVCTIPAGFGVPVWLVLPLGILATVTTVVVVGRPLQASAP
jgi:Na+/H+ antiporter NhaC